MKFYCLDQELKWIKEPSLFGEHLEADTPVMFHTQHANVEGATNIVVRGKRYRHFDHSSYQCATLGKFEALL